MKPLTDWEVVEKKYGEWYIATEYNTSLGRILKVYFPKAKVIFYTWNYPSDDEKNGGCIIPLEKIAWFKLRGDWEVLTDNYDEDFEDGLAGIENAKVMSSL